MARMRRGVSDRKIARGEDIEADRERRVGGQCAW
jgi:hypothetical protein